MTDHSEFYVFAALTASAVALGLLAHRFRQPVIVAFVIVGVLAGPAGTDWVDPKSDVEFFAQLGIAVLLFLVGLKLEVGIAKKMGAVSVIIGVSQMAITFVLGFAISVLLGLSALESLYVGLALSFSSTIIIVKLLSDKRELDSLHGKIAIGVLIIQDIFVIVTIIVLTAIGNDDNVNFAQKTSLIIVKGALLLIGLGVFSKFALKPLLHLAAHSRELLVLFAISYAISIASISDWMGFSTEIGAFLAGVSIASTPYRESIGARLINLRNFFLLFFFIELGANLQFTNVGDQLVKALVLSAFVLLAKPILTMGIMGFMKYSSKVSFRTGISLAQISEFSLILGALGLTLGHINESTVTLITLVGIITISVSTYMIQFSNQFFKRVEKQTKYFERSALKSQPDFSKEEFDVIIYGHGRYGSELANELVKRDLKILVVDYDPKIINWETTENLTVSFGDAEDLDLMQNLPLETTKWVVCTVADPNTNLALASELKTLKYKGKVLLTARNRYDARRIESAGSDIVIQPYAVAAKDTAQEIIKLK